MRLDDADRKKQRKPEQQIYVPRVVQLNRDSTEKFAPPHTEKPPTQHYNDNQNFADKSNNRSKRYSSRRRPSDTQDHREEWRAQSPINRTEQNRNFRQGSEPRNVANNQSNNGSSSWGNRQRDTRSVEPSLPVTGML